MRAEQDDFADDRAELLARVAELYYLEGRDQRTIALEIGQSRSNVSRLLGEARRRGIVEIRISRPLAVSDEAGEEVAHRFGLADARVLASGPGLTAENARRRVGRLAAAYLSDNLRDGLRIGLSWGTSLQAMVDAVAPIRSYDVEVAQLLGGLSWVAGPSWASASLSGHELGRQLADRLGGRFSYLHAPAIVDSAETRESLIHQPSIADALATSERCDLAFVGIGSLGIGSSKKLFEEARLSAAEKEEMDASGAVGDICARLFAIDGKPCDVAVTRRVVGIELDALRRIRRVVGIARGTEKARGILGALRGGYVDVLVTDERTAREVLRLSNSN
jgi:DNA-binding transcriptional regulator LsrR (DeoR family)